MTISFLQVKSRNGLRTQIVPSNREQEKVWQIILIHGLDVPSFRAAPSTEVTTPDQYLFPRIPRKKSTFSRGEVLKTSEVEKETFRKEKEFW